MTADSFQQVTNGVEAVVTNGTGRKPRLLCIAAPADGHAGPILKVAAGLAKRGFPISFITGEGFKDAVEAIGGDFFSVPEMITPEIEAARALLPAGLPRMSFDFKTAFIGWIPKRWEILREALETLRARDASEEIVIVGEPFFMGDQPLFYGAPLPKGFTQRPRMIKLGITPYIGYSIDVGPGGPGLPPDASESGRARNALLHMLFEMGPLAELNACQAEIMKEAGAVDYQPGNILTGWSTSADWTLQMTPPSIEYPRSDLPSNVKFIGCLPSKPVGSDFSYPEWWGEVTKGDRKVLMVVQGTVNKDYTDLIIPTMQAFAEREDVYVVAILGSRGASLPKDIVIPANTRVIDYLSYAALLPHADVFISNGGNGGFLQSITYAVPMVLAGGSEEKPEVCMRGEWSGVAVNLRTGQPSVEQVRNGVDRVLEDPKFKAKVEMVKRENEAMNPLETIEKHILSKAL